MNRFKIEVLPEPNITSDFSISGEIHDKIPLNSFLVDFRTYGIYKFTEGKAFYGTREGMSNIELTESGIDNDFIDYSFPYIYWVKP